MASYWQCNPISGGACIASAARHGARLRARGVQRRVDHAAQGRGQVRHEAAANALRRQDQARRPVPASRPTRNRGDGEAHRSGGEHFSIAGWREDAGFVLFHFTTWAKARAMQHWIDRSGIAGRPMPTLGETAKERAEQRREALACG